MTLNTKPNTPVISIAASVRMSPTSPNQRARLGRRADTAGSAIIINNDPSATTRFRISQICE